MLFTYKLLIAYDGTNYCGWQKQKNGTTIQGLIEGALAIIYKEPIYVTGASRTDSGVHALGQVAHFASSIFIDTRKIQKQINGIIPKDIRILDCSRVHSSFHARYLAKQKTYYYTINTAPIPSPMTRLYSYCIPDFLDISLLTQATQYFVGEMDFLAFANRRGRNINISNSVRIIYSIDVTVLGSEIVIKFSGNGFLYKMIRNIVGTLIAVAQKSLPMDHIPLLLKKRDRTLIPTLAPALGLCLIQIEYDINQTLSFKGNSRYHSLDADVAKR